jgi:uncharacterized protein GlcG (DUF336 family)
MHTTQTLDLNDARTIIDAGIAEAERIGNPMNIAVVDAGGCLLAVGACKRGGLCSQTGRVPARIR